jgi:hypothetical protein
MAGRTVETRVGAITVEPSGLLHGPPKITIRVVPASNHGMAFLNEEDYFGLMDALTLIGSEMGWTD